MKRWLSVLVLPVCSLFSAEVESNVALLAPEMASAISSDVTTLMGSDPLSEEVPLKPVEIEKR